MATFTLVNAQTTVGTIWTGTAPGPGNPTISGTIATSGSTDFSCWTTKVTITTNAEMVDFSSMCSNGRREEIPGIISADITLDVSQDFATGSVDAVFWPLFINKTLTYLDIKPTSSARSSTNPSFVFAAYLQSYTPLDGAVGDRAATSIPFRATGKFDRLTS